MMDTKQFPFPLDTPIKTEKEIERFDMETNKKTGKPVVKIVKDKVIETVIYHDAPSRPFLCAKGEHNYHMIDNKKYTAKCSRCPKYWQMNPQYHKIIDGKILHRDDNHLID